jgi:hypothetical protein
MYVTLVIQHAKRMRSIDVFGTHRSTIFFAHCLINGTIFGKKKLSETSNSKKNLARYGHPHKGPHVQYLCTLKILLHFNSFMVRNHRDLNWATEKREIKLFRNQSTVCMAVSHPVLLSQLDHEW